MMSKSRQKYVVALDQGTSSCRALAVNHKGRVVAVAQEAFAASYPHPGWVEQNADEIWRRQKRVMDDVVQKIGGAENIAGIGITNQRETTVVWDRKTGKPLHPAIVWQCRRSTEICERLKAEGLEPTVREKTGLLLDPYFSATKLTWLFDHFPEWRPRAEAGEILFGTIDSWLLWNLSGGQHHITDITNASRTGLFNIHIRQWDDELLQIFGVPRPMLPRVVSSSERYFDADINGVPVPVAGCAGDQQAALFGQNAFAPGQAKNTYGTGCFLLMNAGTTPPPTPPHGLLSTVAWQINGETTYALEGSVFVAGAAIQWLRDGLGIIKKASETQKIAESVPDTGGVFFVPAFTGLGSPYWEPNARGMITGITRGTKPAHLVRAALESIAFQTRDMTGAMERATGVPLTLLRVDGGAAKNDFLLQFQADVLHLPVYRSAQSEVTALGTAYLAGLAVGFWTREQIMEINEKAKLDTFTPTTTEAEREEKYQGWINAVAYQTHFS